MYYVYQHRKADTNEIFYVGKGNRRRAWSCVGRNVLWKRTAKKHGFIVEFIADQIDEELSFLVEHEAIIKYKAIGINLVNMTDGGEGASGYKHTEEHKQAMKGNEFWKLVKQNGFKGKTHSDEQKAKWSISRKGTTSPRKGIVLDEMTRKKISESRKGFVDLKRRSLSNDQVIEIRKMLITESIASIARQFGVGESTIRRIRNGERYGEVK